MYTYDTGYLSNFFHTIANSLPRILGALLILIIGYFVAKLVAAALSKSLDAIRLNERLHVVKGGNILQRAVPNPTAVISEIGFWLIFLFAISVAVSALGIPALEQIVNGIYSYVPNVIAALIIFLVAGAVSAAVSTLVANTMGDTPTGKIAATAAPIVVMGIASFMILNQLRIAPEIVTITYAGIVGTAVLAFGLGGKDAASRMFVDLYDASKQRKDSVTADLRTGANNAKQQASELRDKAQRKMR